MNKPFLRLLINNKLAYIDSEKSAKEAISGFIEAKDKDFLEITKTELIEQKENVLNKFVYNVIIEYFNSQNEKVDNLENKFKSFSKSEDKQQGKQTKDSIAELIEKSKKENESKKYEKTLKFLVSDIIGKVLEGREAKVLELIPRENIINFDITTGDTSKLYELVLNDYPEWKKKEIGNSDDKKQKELENKMKLNYSMNEEEKKIAKKFSDYLKENKGKNQLYLFGRYFKHKNPNSI